MRLATYLAAGLLFAASADAQNAYSRNEVGVHGAYLGNHLYTERNLGGLGGRYVFNLNSQIAADADFTFYPQYTEPIANHGGRQFTFFAGIKGGIRRKRFAFFGKARPGLRFYTATGISGFQPGIIESRTHFAVDLGGVFEYYPAPHWIVRFDYGEILTRMGDHVDVRDPSGTISARPSVASSTSFKAGVNYRFGGRREGRTPREKRPGRMQAGLQYSLLSITVFSDLLMHDKSAVGAWLSCFLTRHIALDGAASFFPQNSRTVSFQEGGTIAQAFFGAKMGIANSRYGVFAKLRPGLMRFSYSITDFRLPPGQRPLHPVTQFAMDTGGVLELYLPRRTILRFDVSDVTVRYGSARILTTEGSGTLPARTDSAIQLSVGFGIRF